MSSPPLHLLLLLLLLLAGAARSQQQQVGQCDQARQTQMQEQFRRCLDQHTQNYHRAAQAAKSAKERQALLCSMLSKTYECGDVWLECHKQEEVVNMKDMHIIAWLQQYPGDAEGEDASKCTVVREYLESGRADRKASDQEKCTFAQISEAQTDFQHCSYNKSQEVWDEIQDEKDKVVLAHRRRFTTMSAADEAEFRQSEVKPRLCRALEDISAECTEELARCFTEVDTEKMREQHMVQLTDYFSKMYDDLPLEDCYQLLKLLEKSMAKEDTVEPAPPSPPPPPPKPPKLPVVVVKKKKPTVPPATTTTTEKAEESEERFDEEDDWFAAPLDYDGETNEIDQDFNSKKDDDNIVRSEEEDEPKPAPASQKGSGEEEEADGGGASANLVSSDREKKSNDEDEEDGGGGGGGGNGAASNAGDPGATLLLLALLLASVRTILI